MFNQLEYSKKITDAFLSAACLVDFTESVSALLGIHCAILGEKHNDLSLTSPPESHSFLGPLKPFCRIKTGANTKMPIYLGIPVDQEVDEDQAYCLNLVSAFLPKFPEISQPIIFNSDTYVSSLYAFLFSNDFNQMSSLRIRLSLSQLKLYQQPPNCVIVNMRSTAQDCDLNTLKQELEHSFLTVHDSLLQYGGALILMHLFKASELESSFRPGLDAILRKHNAIGCISDIFQDPIRDFRVRVYLSRNEQVLNYLYGRGRDKGLVSYDTYKLVALCYSALEDDKLLGKNQFVCQSALRIYEYDRKHDTEYLRTLLVYLNSRFSLSSTCNILHVHRNTVIYRIERLKSYFGINFDEPWDCFNLLLSCHILDITKYI